jgi:hypothetical protein
MCGYAIVRPNSQSSDATRRRVALAVSLPHPAERRDQRREEQRRHARDRQSSQQDPAQALVAAGFQDLAQAARRLRQHRVEALAGLRVDVAIDEREQIAIVDADQRAVAELGFDRVHLDRLSERHLGQIREALRRQLRALLRCARVELGAEGHDRAVPDLERGLGWRAMRLERLRLHRGMRPGRLAGFRAKRCRRQQHDEPGEGESRESMRDHQRLQGEGPGAQHILAAARRAQRARPFFRETRSPEG